MTISTSSVSPVQILKGSAPSPISNKFLENIVEINIDDSWFGNQGLSGGLTQDGELYVWGTDRTGLIGVEGYSLPTKAKIQDTFKILIDELLCFCISTIF